MNLIETENVGILASALEDMTYEDDTQYEDVLSWNGPDPKPADKRKRVVSDGEPDEVVSRECRSRLRREVEVNVVTVERMEDGDVEGRNTRKEKDVEKKNENDAEKKTEKKKEKCAEKKTEKDAEKEDRKEEGKVCRKEERKEERKRRRKEGRRKENRKKERKEEKSQEGVRSDDGFDAGCAHLLFVVGYGREGFVWW